MTFITCLEHIEPSGIDPSIPVFGDKRTWGVYATWEEGVQALHENWTDMHEGLYDFAVLEECGFGLVPNMSRVQFFQWSKEKGGYEEIATPPLCEHICNFSIG